MQFERSSGILLHPTSLPGPYGIGDIGQNPADRPNQVGAAGGVFTYGLPLIGRERRRFAEDIDADIDLTDVM